MQCLLFGIKFFSLWSTWTLPYPPSSRLHDNNNNFNGPPPHHLSSCLCLCGGDGGKGSSWGHQCQVPHCGHWAGGPNITNLLDFDRAKTTATIAICNRFPHPHGNVHVVVARHHWGRPWQHHCPVSAHFCAMLDSHHVTECRIQELDLPHRGEQMQLFSLEPVLDHWGCLRDAPSRHGACFQGERISHRCTSFQRSIHHTISMQLITHQIIRKYDAISASSFGYLFNEQLATTNFVGCRNIMCSWTRDRSRCIMASKLYGMTFSPCACTTYKIY